MITTNCLECQHPINFESMPEIGQKLICIKCKIYLEVTWLFPIILDYQERESKTVMDPDENLE
jgi:hypothetical protein